MEPGRDPLHARVRSSPLPGGQRQRDAHHDHGLQVHRPTAPLATVRQVKKTRTFETPHVCIVRLIITPFLKFLFLFDIYIVSNSDEPTGKTSIFDFQF